VTALEAPPSPAPPTFDARGAAWALVCFLAVAGALVALSVFAYRTFGPAVVGMPVPQVRPPAGASWIGAFTWWDGWWYVGIAEHGYSYVPGRQSSVAFFPAYPLLLRAGRLVGVPTALAGFAVSLAAGATAAVLFFRWCAERLGRRRAFFALAALLAYPCSFYLAGTVYAEALFVALVVGAFVLLETGRPWAAGLVGAVATATRPIGIALVVALWLRGLELSRQGEGDRRRPWGVLLAPAGLAVYCAHLWVRFGDPLAFVSAEGAPGWGQAPGWATWLKVAWFERMATSSYFNALHLHLAGHALVTVVFLALVPSVFRRFGRAYGVFALLLIAGSALSTRDFTGMARYVLGAFPCFAVAGDVLADHPRVARVAFAASGALLAFFTALHARNMLIS
jgi:hypothetical protein